LIKLSFLSLW